MIKKLFNESIFSWMDVSTGKRFQLDLDFDKNQWNQAEKDERFIEWSSGGKIIVRLH
jgi:hypothetical protein